MSNYIDILKTNNFHSLLKNEKYSNTNRAKKQSSNITKLSLKNDSNLKEKSKEIWTTEYILDIYKNISEI